MTSFKKDIKLCEECLLEPLCATRYNIIYMNINISYENDYFAFNGAN